MTQDRRSSERIWVRSEKLTWHRPTTYFWHLLDFVILELVTYLQSLADETNSSSTKSKTSASSVSTLQPRLEPPWCSAVDAATGITYYYNSVTRVVQWEPPPTSDGHPLAEVCVRVPVCVLQGNWGGGGELLKIRLPMHQTQFIGCRLNPPQVKSCNFVFFVFGMLE